MATRTHSPFETVVVPPVPVTTEEAQLSARRYDIVERSAKMIHPVRSTRYSMTSSPTPLLLTDLADGADTVQLASAVNKGLHSGRTRSNIEGSCGDLGPLVRDALCLALSEIAADHRVLQSALEILEVQAEMQPVEPGALVKLCARVDTEYCGARVTGWLHGVPVLRLHTLVRLNPEQETG